MSEATHTDGHVTILVIDDVPANIGILVDYLEEHGFRVLVAQDGEEGFQRAAFARPNLILLDAMMPGIDGFETCRRLKTTPETSDIPVIFMTALTDVHDKMAGFGAGAVDYVTKPFETAEVLVRINTHLALQTMHAQLETQNRQLQYAVAEHQKAENDLRQALDEINTLNEQQVQTQRLLLQSEKMAAVGQLAAGVAHEINNPIGFVISNMTSLERYVKELMQLLALHEQTDSAAQQQIAAYRKQIDFDYLREDVFALLNESKDGLMRVKKIVQNLKDFSHAGDSVWQDADLHKGLDSTLNLVWNELKYKATIHKEYGDLPSVECLPQEINQVFLNLLVNAGHAIDGHGEITIRTGTREDEAWVEIADNGCGIPPENLSRIFDPFFTTKPVGKGTGLGLSLSYGIVQKHGGRIDVSSECGKGTTFRVYLPVRHAEKSQADQALPTLG
ncbi:His Kinase A (phospho-acceptor) domain-containing protein [Formivibrio citricus]|uniref:histidine kinase n=1 Tax=Formivibrio citricus TaxID=83765 RepID=A0A1I4YDQ2_9NEIS|nr:ATP-binding protein [Formivibrio citricus]SFN35719.1 His Kinase A (phospho-acceptor) domain-containing protein [Formivibrio citricus]